MTIDQDAETVRGAFVYDDDPFTDDARRQGEAALDGILARITELQELVADGLVVKMNLQARITELERIAAPEDFDFQVYLIKRIAEVEAPLQARIIELEANREVDKGKMEVLHREYSHAQAMWQKAEARITELEEQDTERV